MERTKASWASSRTISLRVFLLLNGVHDRYKRILDMLLNTTIRSSPIFLQMMQQAYAYSSRCCKEILSLSARSDEPSEYYLNELEKSQILVSMKISLSTFKLYQVVVYRIELRYILPMTIYHIFSEMKYYMRCLNSVLNHGVKLENEYLSEIYQQIFILSVYPMRIIKKISHQTVKALEKVNLLLSNKNEL